MPFRTYPIVMKIVHKLDLRTITLKKDVKPPKGFPLRPFPIIVVLQKVNMNHLLLIAKGMN
ncbi:hypothetical protein CHI14_02735 [Paenibacillus sp. 7516]|nr:hypothetical protein CHI14_02735 [Paenibacillus sp. 7516]